MSVLSFNKPIDLKNIKKNAQVFFEKRKIIIPLLLAIIGIFTGSFIAKGEGGIISKISDFYSSVYVNNPSVIISFFNSMIIPSLFFFTEFILGLSISGVFIINFIPSVFGILVGIVSNNYYTTYSLKGLAYCILIIFPYSALIILSLIFNAKSNFNMSQNLSTYITRRQVSSNIVIKKYCVDLIKNYIILISGVIIYLICNHFFSEFFNF